MPLILNIYLFLFLANTEATSKIKKILFYLFNLCLLLYSKY